MTKKSLEFLWKRTLSHKISIIFSLCFFAVFMTLVMLCHEEPGAEDYMMCKYCSMLPGMVGTMMTVIMMNPEVSGSRMARSSPLAPDLFTKGVPLFSFELVTSWNLLINIPYAAFIIISGRDTANISDMLISSSVVFSFIMICACLGIILHYGMFIMIFIYMPLNLIIFNIGKTFTMNGFNISLPAAALIFIICTAVCFIISRILCTVVYHKSDFKAYVSNENTLYIKKR